MCVSCTNGMYCRRSTSHWSNENWSRSRSAYRVNVTRYRPPATILDGPIEGRELHEGLDHAERRLGVQARDLVRPEDLVSRRHARVRAAADRRIEVAQVHAGGQIAPPGGWRDAHERIPQREVRLVVLEAVRPEAVEVLLGRVAPPRVHLHVRAVRPGVEILALRARKAQRPLGDEVPLQRGGCRGPEIEWHADELVARPDAKPGALDDAAHPRVKPARRIEDALEDQVLVDLVEDGFDLRAPFRNELERLGLSPGAVLLRSRRRCGLRLGDVGGLRERRGREVAEDRGHDGCGGATRRRSSGRVSTCECSRNGPCRREASGSPICWLFDLTAAGSGRA